MSKRSDIEDDWLKKDSAKFSKLPNLKKKIVAVIVYRDWYAHGESPIGNTILREIRRDQIGKQRLATIASACLAVWEEISKKL